MQRRKFFQGSAVAAAAAVSGCASPGGPQQAPRTPFALPTTYIPVAGSGEVFPVRRIYCIGRNYRAHSIEMGSNPDREPPFFFQKPTDAIQFVAAGSVPDHPYPPLTKNYHYEAELVAAIGKGGRNIPVASALEHVWGYSLGLDMTRRDLQLAAREKSRPWDLGKDVEDSSVVSEIVPMTDTVLDKGALALNVNGKVRQKSDLCKLIWSIPELIADLSKFYHLQPGDLIFTGTPEGVGPLLPGDLVEGRVDGVGTIALTVGAAE